MRLLAALALLVVLVFAGVHLLMNDERSRAEPVLAERIERAKRERASRPAPAELSLAPNTETESATTPAASDTPPHFRAVLFGRVIEMPSGRALADTPVEIASDTLDGAKDRIRKGTRTDGEGRFELVWEGPETAWASARAKRGFVLEDPWKKLDAKQRRGEEEIVLRLRRGRSDVVQGQVVNSLTGEGVFSITVRVAGSGLSETLLTDDFGHFETAGAFPEGKVRVALSDVAPEGTAHLGQFDRAHLEGGRVNPLWRMDVETGPSYYVLPNVGTGLPPGARVALREDRPLQRYSTFLQVAEWGMQVRAYDPEASHGQEHATDADEPQQWGWLTPREGKLPWIRYARQVHAPLNPKDEDRSTDPKLVLDDPTHMWRAEAPVPSIVGHHREPIVLPLEPSAALVGTVGDTTGTPVAGALVKLHRLSREDTTVLNLTETEENGSFELLPIEPGPYRLVVSPPVHAGDELEVRCNPGLNTAPHILLPPAIDVGDVAGEVYIQEGTPHTAPLVTLASAEGSQWRKVVPAKYDGQVGGEHLYRFRFEHVPSGRYEVSMGAAPIYRNKARSPDWTPRKRTVLPPHEGVVFRSRADGEGVDLQVHLETEKNSPSYGASLILGPGGLLQGVLQLDRGRHLRIPRDGNLEWKLISPFHRHASGDERDIVFRDGKAVLDVKLRSGFSLSLHLRGAPKDAKRPPRGFNEALSWTAPIVGAKAYVNHKLVGRSDRSGQLLIDLPRRPQWIGIVAPGWGQAKSQLGESGEVLLWFFRDDESTDR